MPMTFNRFLAGEVIAVSALDAGFNAAYAYFLWSSSAINLSS